MPQLQRAGRCQTTSPILPRTLLQEGRIPRHEAFIGKISIHYNALLPIDFAHSHMIMLFQLQKGLVRLSMPLAYLQKNMKDTAFFNRQVKKNKVAMG